MVCRFIENHRLGVAKENSSEFYAAPLPTRKRLEWLSENVLLQTEVAGYGRSLCLCRITARSLKLLLENRIASHRLVIDGLVDAAHVESCLLELHQNAAESSGIQNSVLGEFFRVSASRILRQVADLSDALDGAHVWLSVAGKNFGESSFSRPISANKPDFVTLGNSKVHLRHEHASTYAYLKVGNGNHDCSKKGGLFSANEHLVFKSPSLQLSYRNKLEIKCRLPSSQSRPSLIDS